MQQTGLVSPQLGQIAAPTLIVTGVNDLVLPHENSDILHRNILGSRLVKVEPAGHGVVEEASEEVMLILKHFLRQ